MKMTADRATKLFGTVLTALLVMCILILVVQFGIFTIKAMIWEPWTLLKAYGVTMVITFIVGRIIVWWLQRKEKTG